MALFGGGVEAARLSIGVLVEGANQAEKDLQGVGKEVNKSAGLFLGIGAAAVAGLGLAAKAAAEEEVGIVRLTSALRANVPAWDGRTAAIEGVISAGEKLAFSDDAQRDALAQLVARTHDVNKALELQATAMDFARLKGIDLSTASEIVGKVYSGNVGILSRYGVAVDKGASSTEALTAIQQASAGQAEAYATTAAGAWASLGIVGGNLVEQIGGVLLPVLTTVAMFATDNLAPAFQLVLDNIVPIGAAVGVVGGIVAASVVPPFIAWAAATIAATWPLLAIGAAVFVVVKALDELGILGPIMQALGQIAGGLGAAIGSAFGFITGAAGKLLGFLSGVFGTLSGLWNGLTAVASVVGQAVSGAFRGMGDTIGGIFSGIGGIVRGAVNVVIGLVNRLIRAWNGISFGGFGIDLPFGGRFDVPRIGTPNIGTIPFLESGAWNILSDTLAYIHRGEMVVPRPQADAIRSYAGGAPAMAGAGGGSVAIYIESFIGSDSDIDRFADKVARRLLSRA